MLRPLLTGYTTYRVGYIVAMHRLSCPARPDPNPRPALPLDQTQAPTFLNTPPSSHGFFDLHDSLEKLLHFLPQLSDVVPLKNGFIVSAHRLTNITG